MSLLGLGGEVLVRLVLSRKGVDGGSGGCASPIVQGVPCSLPIPTEREGVETTYADLGLTDCIRYAKNLTAGQTCHEDPMFGEQVCAFGQTGAAQSHLANNEIGIGDVFLFFGPFSDAKGNDRHHRIFGYLKVDDVILLGGEAAPRSEPARPPARPILTCSGAGTKTTRFTWAKEGAHGTLTTGFALPRQGKP